MTKKLKIKLLLLLALLPMTSLTLVANARAEELQDEIKREKLLRQLTQLRNRILPAGSSQISIDLSLLRYQQITGLTGLDLQQAFRQDLQTLIETKILSIDSEGVIGGSPSDGS